MFALAHPSHIDAPRIGGPDTPDLNALFRSYDQMDATALQAPYALLTALEWPTKPVVFPSLRALARRIHRDRGGEALELRPARLTHDGRARQVTEVLAVDQDAGRTRRLGYAWTAGRPWTALQDALDAELPDFAPLAG